MLEDVVNDFGGGEGLFGGSGDGRGLEVVGAEAFGQVAEHWDAESFVDADSEGWFERCAVGELVGDIEAGIVVEPAGGAAVLKVGGVAVGTEGREL